MSSPERTPKIEGPSEGSDSKRSRAQPELAKATASKPVFDEDAKPVELTPDLDDLPDEQREARRKALKSMLETNQARQQEALRKRRPPMAIGDRIAIVSGELTSRQGQVLDADFIRSRVLLQVDDIKNPLWVPFRYVGSI